MGRSLAILLRISCWDSPRSSRSSSSLSEWDRWNYVGQNTEGKTNTACDLSMALHISEQCCLFLMNHTFTDLNYMSGELQVMLATVMQWCLLERSCSLVSSEGYICIFHLFCFSLPQQANGSKAAQSCDITFSHSGGFWLNTGNK